MNPASRLIATTLLFAVLTGAQPPVSAEEPQFSVMEIPAVEGGDGPQVAVKWSGELPVMLEIGEVSAVGDFVAITSGVELSEPMTLLPHPGSASEKSLVWRVVDDQARALAQTQSRGMSPTFEWQTEFFGPGVDSTVNAVTIYQSDLVIGGSFLTAGDQVVNHIARWDGTDWSALTGPSGTGMNSTVLALTVHDGDLIAGGQFTMAGGVTVNRIARWDGTDWSALSGPSGTGMNGLVQALTVHNDDLTAGGQFTTAGGVAVNHIARWDGTDWSALSGPSGTGSTARSWS